MFNKKNVELVDLKENPIVKITKKGIKTKKNEEAEELRKKEEEFRLKEKEEIEALKALRIKEDQHKKRAAELKKKEEEPMYYENLPFHFDSVGIIYNKRSHVYKVNLQSKKYTTLINGDKENIISHLRTYVLRCVEKKDLVIFLTNSKVSLSFSIVFERRTHCL